MFRLGTEREAKLAAKLEAKDREIDTLHAEYVKACNELVVARQQLAYMKRRLDAFANEAAATKLNELFNKDKK